MNYVDAVEHACGHGRAREDAEYSRERGVRGVQWITKENDDHHGERR